MVDKNDIDSFLKDSGDPKSITTAELFLAFPDIEIDTEELNELFKYLESLKIKVIDEIQNELDIEDAPGRNLKDLDDLDDLEFKIVEDEDELEEAKPKQRKSKLKTDFITLEDASPDETIPERAGAKDDKPLSKYKKQHISVDPITRYLESIGRVKLLSAEQELILAQRVVAGSRAENRLGKIKEHDASDIVTIETLNAIFVDGSLAKQVLVEANLRLVVSVAKRYAGRYLNLLDLVQEGNVGLIKAVERFDPSKGFRFSTYATWWIRQAITKAMAEQSRSMKYPTHTHDTIVQLMISKRNLQQDLNREPTIEELAELTGKSKSDVTKLLRLAQDSVSLETPVSDGDGAASLGDFVQDPDGDVTSKSADRMFLVEAIDEALSGLNDREKQIVMMRFGIEDGRVHTLEELGELFDVTRERIRQIEMRTLQKLRGHKYSKLLEGYLDD
jgi:RNA polymerase primary sigma factor